MVLAFGGAVAFGVWDILLRPNFGEVLPGTVYRSAQLRPFELENVLRERHIRTILNLRGKGDDYTQQEAALAARLGVRMITLELSAKTPPPRETMAQLIESLETAQTPLLLHCYYGNDRSGLASMFVAMARGHQPYEQAKQQLFLWYLRRNSKGRTLTDVVGWYEDYCRHKNLSPDNWPQMRDWLLTKYDPDAPAPSRLLSKQ